MIGKHSFHPFRVQCNHSAARARFSNCKLQVCNRVFCTGCSAVQCGAASPCRACRLHPCRRATITMHLSISGPTSRGVLVDSSFVLDLVPLPQILTVSKEGLRLRHNATGWAHPQLISGALDDTYLRSTCEGSFIGVLSLSRSGPDEATCHSKIIYH